MHHYYLISHSLQTFVTNAYVGRDVDANQLREENDAVVICTGATWPRDLKIPNRDADGIHFAMEFLQVRLTTSKWWRCCLI
jgi:NADPH-dependent glutamate synthase beta subunit-like oxidoreductase